MTVFIGEISLQRDNCYQTTNGISFIILLLLSVLNKDLQKCCTLNKVVSILEQNCSCKSLTYHPLRKLYTFYPPSPMYHIYVQSASMLSLVKTAEGNFFLPYHHTDYSFIALVGRACYVFVPRPFSLIFSRPIHSLVVCCE